MKLKGLLKSFFILGLTLLPISFINAYEVVGNGGQIEVIPPDTAVIGNYIYVFNNNGNIFTDDYGQYLVWYNNNNNNNLRYVYGWIDGKLYFAGFYGNNVQKQGFIQKFSVCLEGDPSVSSKCTDLSINSDDFYQLNTNITKLIIGNYGSNLQDFYGNEPFRLCFYNSNDSNYYCVQNAIRTQGYVDTPLTGSLGFTNIDSLSNGTWGSTPFSPSSSESPVSDIVFYSDNNQVYYDFLTLLGYNSGLCYGDFVLTDITITDGNSFQFFPSEVGTGANIFTLKDYRYSNFDNYSWYGQIRGLYKISSSSNDYTPYMGKSKGYYRLAYKVDNQSYFSAYQPNGTDLFIYCDMALNGFDPNGLFTGKLSSSATNIFINSDYRNHYGENKNGEFVLSGANSYFSGEDVGLFDVFNRLYTRFKNGFKVDGSEDYRVGILPSFVVFGFFLMLLLYLFKR